MNTNENPTPTTEYTSYEAYAASHPVAHQSFWAARTGFEKITICCLAVIAGVGLGTVAGYGVVSALDLENTSSAPVEEAMGDDDLLVPAPVEDDSQTEQPAPTTPVRNVTPTPAPAPAPKPAPTPKPVPTTIDPKVVRQAEIDREIADLDARIVSLRDSIVTARNTEMTACWAEFDRLAAEYDDAKAATARAVKKVEKAQAKALDVSTNPLYIFNPVAKAEALADLADATKALDNAKAAQKSAHDRAANQQASCEAIQNGFGPVDDDPRIVDLQNRRQALLEEYLSLG